MLQHVIKITGYGHEFTLQEKELQVHGNNKIVMCGHGGSNFYFEGMIQYCLRKRNGILRKRKSKALRKEYYFEGNKYYTTGMKK